MNTLHSQNNTSTSQRTSRGFATLFIVIVLSGVALALTLTLSTSGIWAIRSSIDARNSNEAKALANACAEVALEILRENNDYGGSGDVTLNGNTCTYTIANAGGTSRTITVSGTVKDITRKLSITTATFNPLVVSSWQEVP